MVRELAHSVLTKCGYDVVVAKNVDHAQELAEMYKDPIHLLITDVIMPKINGKKLYENIAELRPGIKVLYMSGYMNDLISHQGVLEPGVHLIKKPFTIMSMSRKVRESLDE